MSDQINDVQHEGETIDTAGSESVEEEESEELRAKGIVSGGEGLSDSL